MEIGRKTIEKQPNRLQNRLVSDALSKNPAKSSGTLNCSAFP
jgi:hypothetical protein